jgi:hypothetical protein
MIFLIIFLCVHKNLRKNIRIKGRGAGSPPYKCISRVFFIIFFFSFLHTCVYLFIYYFKRLTINNIYIFYIHLDLFKLLVTRMIYDYGLDQWPWSTPTLLLDPSWQLDPHVTMDNSVNKINKIICYTPSLQINLYDVANIVTICNWTNFKASFVTYIYLCH